VLDVGRPGTAAPVADVEERCSGMIRGMVHDELKRLPGAEIVLAGIEDLRLGRESVNACAVQAAASRLRGIGLDAPGARGEVPAAHRLYRLLGEDLGAGAHSRYNAILARVASFAGAAELAQRR